MSLQKTPFASEDPARVSHSSSVCLALIAFPMNSEKGRCPTPWQVVLSMSCVRDRQQKHENSQELARVHENGSTHTNTHTHTHTPTWQQPRLPISVSCPNQVTSPPNTRATNGLCLGSTGVAVGLVGQGVEARLDALLLVLCPVLDRGITRLARFSTSWGGVRGHYVCAWVRTCICNMYECTHACMNACLYVPIASYAHAHKFALALTST